VAVRLYSKIQSVNYCFFNLQSIDAIFVISAEEKAYVDLPVN